MVAADLVDIMNMSLNDAQEEHVEHVTFVAQVDPEMARIFIKVRESHQQVANSKLRRGLVSGTNTEHTEGTLTFKDDTRSSAKRKKNRSRSGGRSEGQRVMGGSQAKT